MSREVVEYRIYTRGPFGRKWHLCTAKTYEIAKQYYYEDMKAYREQSKSPIWIEEIRY